MCALFNLVKQEYANIDSSKDSTVRIKTASALWHSTVVSAMSFLEAFVNGLAMDYWLRFGDKLEPKILSMLLEFDVEKERPRPLTLREKILQYPKIVTGNEHPPVQESNCPELRFVLTRAKTIRDAAVHASARMEIGAGSATSPKIQERLAANFTDVEEAVSSVLTVVRRIAEATSRDRSAPSWFKGLDERGLFPDSVFE